MKRVIVSDTHIGTKFYKADALHEFLENTHCDELILAGDIIDFIKIPVFTERCLQIIEKMKEAKRVIYVVGNHDEGLTGLAGKKVMGVEFVKRYEFEEGGRKFRIEHGDAYDKGVLHNRIFVKFLSVIQNMLEFAFNFDFTTWWTEIQIKKHKLRSIIHILRHHPKIDVFIMGYTHIPEALIWVDEDENIKVRCMKLLYISQANSSIVLGLADIQKFHAPGPGRGSGAGSLVNYFLRRSTLS